MMSRSIGVQDGANTVLKLDEDRTSGLYLVNITAGNMVKTERLVIRK